MTMFYVFDRAAFVFGQEHVSNSFTYFVFVSEFL